MNPCMSQLVTRENVREQCSMPKRISDNEDNMIIRQLMVMHGARCRSCKHLIIDHKGEAGKDHVCVDCGCVRAAPVKAHKMQVTDLTDLEASN